MKQAIIITFLVLFIGRMAVRFVLEKLNIKNLQLHGSKIPASFGDEIDPATLKKMVDYSFDQSRLETKENLAGDIVELAVLFGLVPYLACLLSGAGLHLIWQALAFFAVLAAISGLVSLPFDIYHTFVLELKHGFSTILETVAGRSRPVACYFRLVDGGPGKRADGFHYLSADNLVAVGLGIFHGVSDCSAVALSGIDCTAVQ